MKEHSCRVFWPPTPLKPGQRTVIRHSSSSGHLLRVPLAGINGTAQARGGRVPFGCDVPGHTTPLPSLPLTVLPAYRRSVYSTMLTGCQQDREREAG